MPPQEDSRQEDTVAQQVDTETPTSEGKVSAFTHSQCLLGCLVPPQEDSRQEDTVAPEQEEEGPEVSWRHPILSLAGTRPIFI